MKMRIIVGIALAVAGAGVFAQDNLPEWKLEAGFVMFDRDKNDALSETEFKKLGEFSTKLKGKPEVVKSIFIRLDSNRDGLLSRSEYRQITAIGNGKSPAEETSTTEVNAVVIPKATLNNDSIAFFEKKIRPVLVDRCYSCHAESSEEIAGGLVLDTRDGIRRGGSSGPGVVPGKLDTSLVIEAIRYRNDDLKMPPEKNGGKLPDEVIADFEKWVKMGAPDPREGQARKVEPGWDMENAKSHWAFQPMSHPVIPTTSNRAWPRNDIDRFVLAGLEAKGLKPVADAGAETLIRRLHFDLIGLPPTPEEVQRFVQAHRLDTQAAVRASVDSLMSMPQFGERWGRHWLDIARYAESTGKDVNLLMPHAWRYRDYVIDTFNRDKPIDEFFREQVAGDLLPFHNDRDRAMKQIATGFLAVGTRSLNERNSKQFALDTADEQIDTLSQAMLGITVACARCHDHKFDPIPQRDYYALAGIFLSTETCFGTAPTFQNQRATPLIELSEKSGLPRMPDRLSSHRRSELENELTKMQRYGAFQFYGAAVKSKLTGQGADINNDPKKLVMFVGINAKIGELKTELATYESDGRQKLLAVGVRDYPTTIRDVLPENPRTLEDAFAKYAGRPNQFRKISDCPLYLRGDVEKPSQTVARGLPTMLGSEAITIASSESGRRELADWLVSETNPLTSRVFVNRVWHWIFGSGIVDSVDNFGTTGQSPSNLALLDHLASRFKENGWSLKTLIREIVLSRSYQLASTFDPKNADVDPANDLVWRMSPRRLDAECIRDAMLAVAGDLQLQPPVGSVVAQRGDAGIGGYLIKSMRAPLSDDLFLSTNTNYRSVYLPIPRNAIPESLSVFDFAEPNTVAGSREVTTVPSQALFLLNNEFVGAAALGFAKRLLKLDASDRIDSAFQIAYSRSPSTSETDAVKVFFADYPKRDNEIVAWISFCRALLAGAEFRSLD
jgi:Protein of unknown function (DUF1553)/Protein of unknown function (DUF1549)/Planctomycete cytochrome C